MDGRQPGADGAGDPDEPVHGEGAQQERQRQAGGVGRQQQHAAVDLAGGPGQRQDGAEDRPHARYPRHRKGKPHYHRADIPGRFAAQVELRVAFQGGDLEQPGQVEPHHQDEQATADAHRVLVPDQQPSQQARGRPQGDEGDREAEHEGHGVAHDPGRARRALPHLPGRYAGYERQVGRDQRQHAGAEER